MASSVDLSWMIRGNCVNDPRDIFFPERGGPTVAARKVCAECTVKTECLEYALVYEEFGIWGGTSPDDRKRLRRERRLNGRRPARTR